MRKTSLIDRELFRIFQELIDGLIDFVPQDFDSVVCFIELGSKQEQPQLYYHIHCPDSQVPAITEPNERISRSSANLLAYFSRNGNTFPGFRITLQRQESGHWKNDIQRLDSQSSNQFASPIPRPLDRP
jgi:hypothetical protein